MLIDYAAITHAGRVRKNNEDAYLVSGVDGEEPQVNGSGKTPKFCKSGLLAAVADGMGGAAAGEIASREGVAAVAVYMFGHWGVLPPEQATESTLVKALHDATTQASEAVLRWSDSERSARGMGSTLTAAMVWKGYVYLAQVGDSRCYLFRRGVLTQLTVDQTLVNELITSGTITAEQARTHPQRNMITQALGCPQPVKPIMGRISLRRGDRILLCSDGLHGEVEDAQIQDTLAGAWSPKKTLELLVSKALAHGGRDNVTGLLLALDDLALPLPDEYEPDLPKVEDPFQPRNQRKDKSGKFRSLFGGKG